MARQFSDGLADAQDSSPAAGLPSPAPHTRSRPVISSQPIEDSAVVSGTHLLVTGLNIRLGEPLNPSNAVTNVRVCHLAVGQPGKNDEVVALVERISSQIIRFVLEKTIMLRFIFVI